MSIPADTHRCPRLEIVSAYALHALPADEGMALQAHIDACPECQRELQSLSSVADALASWPTDVLRPSPTLRELLARRIARETGGEPIVPATQWLEPEWEEVGPGISCKLLATDQDRDRVSMLVRLAPGATYPSHSHAGVEELHLLDGELWIDDRKLHPGDYNHAEPGTGDERVWSETGCTCVLITSPSDILK
jgi:anti-sigma factor ChrR (cupin superfamily)